MKLEIEAQIKSLEEKYKNSGQDLSSYLDGLLYERYLTYWDYIHLDTLLSLQIPRTHFPDEEIFIMYHQITELYFKLIIHEQKQIIDDKVQKADFLITKIERINNYYKILINSFNVMINGMDRAQFLKYRMALLPASGFQSAQFRMIELYSTSMYNLLHPSVKHNFSPNSALEDLYENIYWKKGAVDTETNEKTLTLKQFEYRYTPRFMRIAKEVQGVTIYEKYLNLPKEVKNNKLLIEAMKQLDVNANVNWNLMHMGAAYKHLSKEKQTIDATGGTNWKEYLPPSFQKIIFFPEIWSENEKADWGKQWVEHMFNPQK
ncbi:tryptophan 2,3-dioxygenase family protein [Galbibacter pacificus]|uniref:Tryptophan 2,3-dioxygenase family protein n=1 Tax=Galbibacter pacificus TaxID=2996052 RepID=A0ABT6FU43_9FLAO|nr:tryptophan 2,3-dioxygenase family protein [Galbibacter pacificus]MDG3583133.1 tryptophan 2,3-dioxygenase family protein [Galbibacter pacificus]MDG3586614.1 tryptophan 2,3-dioxygenase family protein [Galbibacter pacificus]